MISRSVAVSRPSTLSMKIGAVHVGVGEAVALRIEFGMRLGQLQAERVELRLQMAAHAVGADQHQRAQRGDNLGARVGARDCRASGRWGADGGRLGHGGGERVRGPGGAGRILQHRAGLVVHARRTARRSWGRPRRGWWPNGHTARRGMPRSRPKRRKREYQRQPFIAILRLWSARDCGRRPLSRPGIGRRGASATRNRPMQNASEAVSPDVRTVGVKGRQQAVNSLAVQMHRLCGLFKRACRHDSRQATGAGLGSGHIGTQKGWCTCSGQAQSRRAGRWRRGPRWLLVVATGRGLLTHRRPLPAPRARRLCAWPRRAPTDRRPTA